MSDNPEAVRLELDDWRDLVNSAGWKRLTDSFEAQWGDASIVRTLEQYSQSPHQDTTSLLEQAKHLMALRMAMRNFLFKPHARISELERQQEQRAVKKVQPWTREDPHASA